MLQGTDGRPDPISTINVLSEREHAVFLTCTVFSSCTRTQTSVSYADVRLFCALILLESCSRYVEMSSLLLLFYFYFFLLYAHPQTQHTVDVLFQCLCLSAFGLHWYKSVCACMHVCAHVLSGVY